MINRRERIVTSQAMLMASDSSSTPEDAASPSDARRASNALVLVVEDDPRSARVLAASLKADGYRVAMANDGNQFSQLMALEPPAMIVCDVLLPGVDGIELTRGVRAKPATRSIPVLLVTSLDDRKVLSRGLEAGADDILIKPIHPLELRTRVAALVRKKELADEYVANQRRKTCFRPVDLGTTAQSSPNSAPVEPAAAASSPATVLIVEDDDAEFESLSTCLAEMGCRVARAENTPAAMRAIDDGSIDLCVLDLMLPQCSGYALIEHMRRELRHAQTPILIVSSMTEVHDRVKALEMGADDFIVKGFDPLEFQARARRLLRLKLTMDQLTVDYDQAIRQATTDSLTGLGTRSFLEGALQRQCDGARRYGWPLSLIFLDIDHFKSVNDQHGHPFGDRVLQSLGETIRAVVRGADVAARYGGEEFIILAPHTGRAEAGQLAERLRCAVEERGSFRSESGDKVNVTVSLGIASFPEDAPDGVTLLQHADEALYKAKRDGRNRVVVYSPPEARAAGHATVLIADDDERNLKLLEAYLLADGYQTSRARDGREALDIARRERPDLILLDGMMPQMTGFDACRAIKEDNDLRLTPIILVTALNGRDDKLQGIESGADDFLTKPIDKVALLMRMRALLKTKRTTDLLEDAETVIFALARSVEARDPSTGGHVERVSHYAAALGRAAGLSDSQIEGLRRAGVVHDIGKIVIPDSVLLKPGALTPDERRVIQTHVEVGYELLRPMRTFTESLPAVRFHHERLNGSGYPLGLRGEQIPITAQILAIVDVYDSLTTDRVYRSAMSVSQAINVLRDEAAQGLHEPRLIDLLEQVVLKLPAASQLPNPSLERELTPAGASF
jgi:putative two-component system response regulator